jgi:hypothetical protein
MLRGILEDDAGAPSREQLEAFVSFLEAYEREGKGSGKDFVSESATPTDADGVFRIRTVLSVTMTMASLFEQEIRMRAPDLLARFERVALPALAGMRLTVEILTAGELNASGTAKGESLDDRLQRSIDAAKRSPSTYLGSFAQYADDDATDAER